MFLLVFSIAASIAIIGINLITIIAILKREGLEKPIYTFILGLAIADGMVGLFALCESANRRANNTSDAITDMKSFFVRCLIPMCPVLAAGYLSNIFEIVIAIDRFASVMKPIEHRKFVTKRMAKGTFAGAFVLTIFMSSMPMYWNNFPNERLSYSCIHLVFPTLYYVGFLLPVYMLTISILIFIYIQVYRVAITKSVDEKQALKMVAVILSCYCICWLPQMVFMIVILVDAENRDKETNERLIMIYEWLLLLALFNSFINPIIYSWRVPEIKKSVHKTLCWRKAEGTDNPPCSEKN